MGRAYSKKLCKFSVKIFIIDIYLLKMSILLFFGDVRQVSGGFAMKVFSFFLSLISFEKFVCC